MLSTETQLDKVHTVSIIIHNSTPSAQSTKFSSWEFFETLKFAKVCVSSSIVKFGEKLILTYQKNYFPFERNNCLSLSYCYSVASQFFKSFWQVLVCVLFFSHADSMCLKFEGFTSQYFCLYEINCRFSTQNLRNSIPSHLCYK